MKHLNTDSFFSIDSEQAFNELALKVFQFQHQNNKVYSDYIKALGIETSFIKNHNEIPFLPIEFFKSREVLSAEKSNGTVIFTSSSTTSQMPSKHIVTDINIYEKSFLTCFDWFYGSPADYVILALLPNYLEREGSSLVYMFNKLIQLSGNSKSGFFLNNYQDLKMRIEELKNSKQKTILIGVSYALLDLAELGVDLSENFIVMETGGMKGRRAELLKEELHAILKEKLKVKEINSEYGMTELLSQAYSKGDGVYECPPWMRVLIRDRDDPLSLARSNATGGINIIDLANVNSCSFIATQDLGRLKNGNTFELMGRFDASDVRGCNLMIS